MHIQTIKGSETWKGQSYESSLALNVQKASFFLVLKMAVHIFKRFWRLIVVVLFSFGLMCIILFAILNRELPTKFAHEETPFSHDNTVFHKSRNEEYVFKHPKSLKKPSILQEAQENEHFEKKNDVKKFISRLSRNQVDSKTSTSSKKQHSKKLKPSKSSNFEKIQQIVGTVSMSIEIGKNESKDDKNLKQNPKTNHTTSTYQINTDVQTKSQKKFQIPNYYEDNLRSNWTFKITRNYDQALVRKWTEPMRLNVSNPLAPGENGAAYLPANDEIELMKQLKDQYNFNAFASDKISSRRSLPDYRFPECRSLVYPDKLPTTSVIVVIHNEIWSTLLRTIWSIIDRSPRELIEEIILVDDDSKWSHLKQPLDDYVATLPANVKIIRTKKREGLIRARLIGANNAKGNILTFLDAHMECTEGWLQPILSRIANDRSVVVVPLIDAIISDNMRYSAAKELQINTLRWNLIFHWMYIPQRELKRTNNDPTAPIRTPTHVGCAFSIDREFFFEIGSYDEGMDIWGSENVELAFRVWLCGGALEAVPCSRVAHLYRQSTYSFDGNRDTITNRNSKRVVEVWMDDFKELFYAAYPEVRKVSAGNLTERFDLKKRLKCKNFQWYLNNIYPESTLLKEYLMMGEMKNVEKKWCLDIYTTSLNNVLKLFPCHGVGSNQFFAFAKSGHIVTRENICVGIKNKTVILVRCEEDKTQLWDFNQMKQWIVHRESGLCMRNNEYDVIIGNCNSTDIHTKWIFKSTWLHHKLPSEKSLIQENDEHLVTNL
ncbi:polypeptide N-acetylgalactosaminyltransferase 13-like [Contarinia nasturtii]|uniref:polypeptide N-acetylgalactosaminyltransferase 13-like n=1 Tax=Contarinia nasturtii TaxID=265458 RepID=UPI0012D4B50D|nr:polypeptide N-acetylgalactosaminyltransferase 13-like [Contarinia nasturtii]